MGDNKKIKFNYSLEDIDSVYVFEDGDFILFSKIKTSLFDSKTLKPKLNLNVTSDSCFFDLKDFEFGLCLNYNFKIYKFNKERTGYKEIQSIHIQPFETGKKLMKLSNNDIVFNKFYMASQSFSIYRKSPTEMSFSAPEENIYVIQNQIQIESGEEIIELNKDEFLLYKRTISTPESLILFIYNSKDYKLKIRKTVMAEIKDEYMKYKKKLYFTFLCKYDDTKLIASGSYYIYIIDLKTLELETTIKMDKIISQIIIRPKKNILLLSYNKDHYQKEDGNEFLLDYRLYYINDLKIDFNENEIIKSREIEVTHEVGRLSSFYKIYNYLNNGLITTTDSNLIIYENYDD